MEVLRSLSHGQMRDISSEKRLLEHLSWRALWQEIMPDVCVEYNTVGAPCFEGGYMSVSHTKEFAAIVISPQPCGVDVESLKRDFQRVKTKYLSEQELLMEGMDTNFLAVAWSAKEALYKMHGEREIDLKADICLSNFNPSEMTITGRIKESEAKIDFMECENHIISFIG